MREKVPLEETVRRESDFYKVLAAVVIPGYSFKLWNDDRKKDPSITGDIFMGIQFEICKSFAYAIAGTVIYDLVSKYFSR